MPEFLFRMSSVRFWKSTGWLLMSDTFGTEARQIAHHKPPPDGPEVFAFGQPADVFVF